MRATEIAIEVEDQRAADPPGIDIAALVATSGLTHASAGSTSSNLALAQQVANTQLAAQAQLGHQQGLDRLRVSILARAVQGLQSTPAITARSAVAALTGNDPAQRLAALRAVQGKRR